MFSIILTALYKCAWVHNPIRKESVPLWGEPVETISTLLFGKVRGKTFLFSDEGTIIFSHVSVAFSYSEQEEKPNEKFAPHEINDIIERYKN